MNEKVQHYRESILKHWQQLTKQQKMYLLAIVALLLVTITAFVIFASKTEYEVVFTNLDASDAAEIKGYLDQNGIPYELQLIGDGTAISVPKVRAADVKLGLASTGLPKSGSIGYEIFRNNMSSFGTSDAEFTVLERDAMSGELEKLIKNIKGVKDAQVMITLPQENLFVTDQQDSSTASVILTMDPTNRIDDAKIKTLYQLVSKSVPHLPLENITISNQYGELLDVNQGQTQGVITGVPGIDEQFKIRKQYENDIQRNVQQLLGTIIGRDKVIVSVVSNMNFDQKNETQTLVEPVNKTDNSGIPISVEEISKSYSGDGNSTPPTGTGSTDIPGYPAGGGGGKSNYDESQKRINLEVNRISKQIQSSPYTLRDLTINVGIEPPIPNKPESLTLATQDAIKKVLANVVRASLSDTGQALTDAEVSNKISVFPHVFVSKNLVPTSSSNSNWWLYGGTALAVLALAGVGFGLVRRRKNKSEVEDLHPVAASQMDIENLNESSEVKMRKQLEQLARKKPDEFVKLLRTWIVDE